METNLFVRNHEEAKIVVRKHSTISVHIEYEHLEQIHLYLWETTPEILREYSAKFAKVAMDLEAIATEGETEADAETEV